MLGEHSAIHVCGDERVGVERFFDRDAANEWRNFAWDLVEAAKHDVFAGGLHACTLQDIAQSRAAELGCAHRTFAPLDSGDLWTVKAATIAGAFQRVDDRGRLEFGKIGKRQGQLLLDFTANAQSPRGRVEFAGFVHVIAHEEVRDRCQPGIKIFDGGLKIDKTK